MINTTNILAPMDTYEIELINIIAQAQQDLKELQEKKAMLYNDKSLKWTKSDYSLIEVISKRTTYEYRKFTEDKGYTKEDIPSKLNISKKYKIVKK